LKQETSFDMDAVHSNHAHFPKPNRDLAPGARIDARLERLILLTLNFFGSEVAQVT